MSGGRKTSFRARDSTTNDVPRRWLSCGVVGAAKLKRTHRRGRRLYLVCALVDVKLLGLTVCTSIIAAPLLLQPQMRVWKYGPSTTGAYPPVRNQPFEDNRVFSQTEIRRVTSIKSVWDGTARRITLKAARNETVAFQIVIDRTGETLSNVMVAPAELAGPNGAKISLENIDLFREWYVYVKNPTKESYTLGPGWYADGFAPLTAGPGYWMTQGRSRSHPATHWQGQVRCGGMRTF